MNLEARYALGPVLASVILVMATAAARGQALPSRPMQGYVGGPYKAIADDFAGGGIVDVLVSYCPIDAIRLEQGNGQGGFECIENGVTQSKRGAVEPIFNIAHGKIAVFAGQ